MPWLPPSPVFLASKGRLLEAVESLKSLRGAGIEVEEEMKRIVEEVEKEGNSVRLCHLLKERKHCQPFLLAIALMTLAQLVGIDYIISYTTIIFEVLLCSKKIVVTLQNPQSSGSNISPCLSSVVVAGVMVIGNIVTVVTIDKIGRRYLLLISTLLICLSTAGVGAFFRLKEAEDPIVPQLGWLPLASFIIFIFVFSIGLGPVPWVLLVEFMPLESMVRIVAKSLKEL